MHKVRHDRTAKSFAYDQHVGYDLVVFAREHAAGTTEAVRNLVKDEQGAVAIAGGVQRLRRSSSG